MAVLMATPEIEKRIWWELKEVHGDGHVKAVTIFNNQTGEEDTLPVEAVLLNLGFKPDTGPIKNWGLELDGRYIAVDQLMATNIPGVYTAGDVASPKGGVRMNLIATGFAQAAVAVNCARNYIDPAAWIVPGHSSQKRL